MATTRAVHKVALVTTDDGWVLDLELLQGLWTESQYLKLTDHSRRLLECSDGSLELLTMPSDKHQSIGEHGIFRGGDTASSALLTGYAVDVNGVFDAVSCR